MKLHRLQTRLTKAQKRVLQTCADVVVLEIGGPDATPGVRRDVVSRLALLRLIEYRTPPTLLTESAWAITQEGRAALAAIANFTRQST